MILRPILTRIVRPIITTIARNVRPTIRINKERFEISLDVHYFTLEEIRVKARPEYLIVEGKQERVMKNGYYVRQFVRKFKLPSGCHPDRIESSLSDAGILTITAKRQSTNYNVPCETTVPISYVSSGEEVSSFVSVEDKAKNACDGLSKDDKKDAKKP